MNKELVISINGVGISVTNITKSTNRKMALAWLGDTVSFIMYIGRHRLVYKWQNEDTKWYDLEEVEK